VLESRFELVCPLGRRLCAGEVDDDPERFLGSQLTRPSNDIVLDLRVEISFAEGERVQGVKELGDLSHAELDRIPWGKEV
jgi:hypothetical protein